MHIYLLKHIFLCCIGSSSLAEDCVGCNEAGNITTISRQQVNIVKEMQWISHQFREDMWLNTSHYN